MASEELAAIQLEQAESSVAQFANLNAVEIGAALRAGGESELAAELDALLTTWRAASNAFLSACGEGA